jgi:hypothetical protein
MKPFIEARKLGLALDLDQTVVDQHITKQDYERLKEDPKYAGHVHSFRSEKGHMVYIVVIPGIGDWLRELSEKFYLYVVTRSIDVHRTAVRARGYLGPTTFHHHRPHGCRCRRVFTTASTTTTIISAATTTTTFLPA